MGDSARPIVQRRRGVQTTVACCLVLSTRGVVAGHGQCTRAVNWTRVDRCHRAAAYRPRRRTGSLQQTHNHKIICFCFIMTGKYNSISIILLIQYNMNLHAKTNKTSCQFNLAHKLTRTEMLDMKAKKN